MDFFEAESKLRELNNQINKGKSPRFLIFLLVKYLIEINKNFDGNLREPFICDLLPIFPSLLKKYSPFGVEPYKTRDIIVSIESMLLSSEFKDQFSEIKSEIERIKNELNDLENSLKGINQFDAGIDQIYFPTIDQSNDILEFNILIDSLQATIIAKRGIDKNEFLLHPSAVDVEKRIKHQVEISWEYAKDYVTRNFGKEIPTFQIVIKFEKPYAIYEGASLGIALVISFISQLVRYLNIRDEVNLKNSVISTGEVKRDGNIPSMTSKIIQQKLSGVFFSTFSTFIIPKSNENSVLSKLDELQKKHPKRILEIIAVKNVEDIFNRRNLVEINKTNLLRWGGRKVIRNKLSLSPLIALISLVLGYFIFTIDNNPVKIDFVKGSVQIKNVYDKLLWSKPTGFPQEAVNNANGQNLLLSRIIDFDNDGKNEVLLTCLKDEIGQDHNIYLFDSEGNEIWKYYHIDTVETIEEKFTHTFSIKGIIDTIHNYNVIELLVYFQHEIYYPSGIVKLNLKTGKQISDVLWHPGAIGGAILHDWNSDGKKEIIAGGVSNGMERAFLFSIDNDKLKGTFPTAKNYHFVDFGLADFNKYILFPQTDYAHHFFPKYNSVHGVPDILDELISIIVYEGRADMINANFKYAVRLNKKLKPIYPIIGDEAVVHRDKLVNEGLLKPPFTDTDEFKESIMDNIEYWDKGKFRKFN